MTPQEYLNRPAPKITLGMLQRSNWASPEAKLENITHFLQHGAVPEYDEDGKMKKFVPKKVEKVEPRSFLAMTNEALASEVGYRGDMSTFDRASAINQLRAKEPVEWGSQFVPIEKLEKGGVKMLIEGFLPEGFNMLGALPGCGKTWFALSLAKALTTGKKFLGRFEVKEPVPVLYLIPESSGASFRARAEKFGIPNDPNLFLCRTVSQGGTLLMSDPAVLAAVEHLKPVVILDTAIRFNRGDDENSASSNKLFVDDAVALRAAGARGVFGLHHATKSSRKEGLTQENALRGTGDLAAMCDSVYGLKRNETLYNDGHGPFELEVICLKPRDFEPPAPFTIAATKKAADESIVSYIDTIGDFQLLDGSAVMQDLQTRFVKEVTALPSASMEDIAEIMGVKKYQVQRLAKHLGYVKKYNKDWSLFRLKVDEAGNLSKKKEKAVVLDL
jgi:hypothetical protein